MRSAFSLQVVPSLFGMVTHAMEEHWKWQWFYSIMASSFGLQLSVTLMTCSCAFALRCRGR